MVVMMFENSSTDTSNKEAVMMIRCAQLYATVIAITPVKSAARRISSAGKIEKKRGGKN